MRVEHGEPSTTAAMFDLGAASAYTTASAHGLWRELRETEPVRCDVASNGTPYWSFFRYHECDVVVKDTALFSSEYGTILASVGAEDPAGGKTITLTDPPRHAALRRPPARRLGPAAVHRREADIRAEVVRLITPWFDGGEHDIAMVLRRLPMVVAGPLIGIPERHWDAVAFHSTASIAPEDARYASGRGVADTLRRAHHYLFSAFSDALNTCRGRPGDNVVSALLSTELDCGPLDEQSLLLNCYSFALGANSTTSHVAAHLLMVFAERPGVWQQIIDEPALIPTAVEEGVRWSSPTNHLVRRVTADTNLGGARLGAGDWVCAWVASANRDEAVFASPFRFDPRRSPNPHLGFGGGPHYCIGAPSSRLALQILLEELAQRRLRFTLSQCPTHLQSNWINGISSLPMRITV
jgi:cytochrome P450